ncbi:MAG: inorganic phosphate transporter [Oscillatoriaceae bacterium SKW80]|nr:inorganic phosphate transporter [Oscillatoriaceae bacterium SKYG93]MCX8120133.1 inorganic phosphate transporter [Oscillatoriaceae bacterium SKW80]MDW8453059.1 anion permease [Oscillatoriaceae cyanobacterium SKYGB_i_bin93]HIK29030.1 inorganic phosphate transporter [Oscillatoriaceae cyanobacterium M7585_C2015_266]
MIFLLALVAFYVAWNLGANDVANSMGTSVGSKALTLQRALLIAGILELAGAVLFGQNVAATLATEIVNPAIFASEPLILLAGMTSVMIACGLWMQVATYKGWPVSSSHAVVGALAGFSWSAKGVTAVDWSNIGIISLTWLATPLISGAIAGCFYILIKHWILNHPKPLQQLNEWIPWLSSLLLSIFGAIVLPTFSPAIETRIKTYFGFHLPSHDIPLGIGASAALCLSIINWRQLESKIQSTKHNPHNPANTIHKTSKSPLTIVEQQLAGFQILSACFVAFAHGSNDVGNAVAPLAAIAYIHRTGSPPGINFSIPLWILLLGGAGIVCGLAISGKKVITTVGEGIIPLQPSGGFCAELACATTVLFASRLGLPVSTSHALVGGVVGIGIVQRWYNSSSSDIIRLPTVWGIFLAWLITVPLTAALGATIFTIARALL